jgi:hypothetical protein
VETGQSIDHLTLAPDGKTLAVTYQTPGQVGGGRRVLEYGARPTARVGVVATAGGEVAGGWSRRP